LFTFFILTIDKARTFVESSLDSSIKRFSNKKQTEIRKEITNLKNYVNKVIKEYNNKIRLDPTNKELRNNKFNIQKKYSTLLFIHLTYFLSHNIANSFSELESILYTLDIEEYLIVECYYIL
jgi:phenylalanyl-tRNA synthetase alpha subunit